MTQRQLAIYGVLVLEELGSLSLVQTVLVAGVLGRCSVSWYSYSRDWVRAVRV